MKKLLALLLVVSMLIPFGMVTSAEATQLEEDPIYLINWSPDYDMDYIYHMFYFWADSNRLDTPLECVRCSTIYPYYDVKNLASALKTAFDAYPDGTRYINFTLVNTAFHNTAEDAIYMDKGVEICQTWLEAFLSEYKAIGGKLDGLVCDLEPENLYCYYLNERFFQVDQSIYQKIYEDPRFETDIRPLLDARGFKYYANVTEATPALYTLHPRSGDVYAQSRSIWDSAVRSYINSKVTEACSPLWKYYPDAHMNDYQSADMQPWMKQLSEHGAIDDPTGGNTFTAGTASTTNFYFNKLGTFFKWNGQPYYNTIAGYNGAYLEDVPFTYFMVDVNIARNLYLASEDHQVVWWIADYIYSIYNKNGVSLTPYYTETLLHLGMLNPQVFNGFIVHGYNNLFDEGLYKDCLAISSDVLKELNRMVGYKDREPIAVQPEWNDNYMLSGMRIGNKNVWRITPDISKISLKNFKVADAADPTFYFEGQTITFPKGKIVTDSNIGGLDANYNKTDGNSCGYWIETPADIMPVVTRVENFHSEYPAYEDDYESYNVGINYGYTTAKPVACWQIKKSGSGAAATIQANPANKDDNVLAMKGNFTLTNINMPQNITAGDSYAEHQTWEVSVTLPNDMADDAEVVLLNASGAKKRAKDTGFKINRGKVYYSDDNGEYIKLNGVTLEAGKEYTFKREMDFSDANAPLCNYYVYDANGYLIGGARRIKIGTTDLPIANIALSVSKVTGDPVLLDDYKLYATKTATDFELYKAELGMPVENIDEAVREDVGYRLSWMNATNERKSFTLMAAYYSGEKLISQKTIKEIKMGPNTEGIETGVVELGNNASGVRVYVRDNNTPEKQEVAGDINEKDVVEDNKPSEESKPIDETNPSEDENSGNGNNAVDTEATDPTAGNSESTASSTDTNAGTPSDGFEPSEDVEATETVNSDADGEKKDLSAGVIVLLVVLSLAALGGGFALYWFVIKPKLAERAESAPLNLEATQVVPMIKITDISEESVVLEEANAVEDVDAAEEADAAAESNASQETDAE